MGDKKNKGVKLDCSARFYPIIATRKYQSLYHICVTLDEDVPVRVLERAINDVLPLFPTFKTKLKCGYAWHRLVPNDAPVAVGEFDGDILRPIDKKSSGGYMFRFSARGNEIHLDFFHGLADGNGSLAFVLAAIKRMRQLEGINMPNDDVADMSFVPTEEESEDAFERYYRPIKLGEIDLKGMAGGTPHRRSGSPVKRSLGYASFEADSAALTRLSKAAGASFTAYLAGIVASVLEDKNGDKPVVIMIPVNLRTFFPSKTQRNFVLFARIVISPGKCSSLDDYVAEAKAQLAAGLDKDKLLAQLSTTVKGMTNPLMSVVPIFLKRLGARIGRLIMRSRQTLILSNIGRINVAPEYGIRRVVYNLNVSENNVGNLAVTSCGGKTIFSFTSAIKEDKLEKDFCDALEKLGAQTSPLFVKPGE